MRKRARKRKSPKSSKVQITIKRQILGEAPNECTFVVCDGRIVKDLKELADALHDMSNDVFSHHVNEFKNDFEKWVGEVMDESELAEELSKVSSQAEAEIAVLRNIVKKISR
ncbi:hypothetical protein JXB11_00410 [Candidatus Woesearchaeota archaeon]|nr:hypothetical protein [Candidatus Woesearchaeota archaeon]